MGNGVGVVFTVYEEYTQQAKHKNVYLEKKPRRKEHQSVNSAEL